LCGTRVNLRSAGKSGRRRCTAPRQLTRPEITMSTLPSRPLRILLATLGSRGDVEPFVHLGRRALAAGHSVLLASPDQADLPTDGLDVVSLGVRFSDLAPGPGTSPGRAFREHIRP